MKYEIVHYRKDTLKTTNFSSLNEAERKTGINLYFISQILKGSITDKDGNYFRYQTEDDKLPSKFLSVKRRMAKLRKRDIEPKIKEKPVLKEPKYIQEEKLEKERVERHKIELIRIKKEEREAQIRNKIENDCDDYYKSFAL